MSSLDSRNFEEQISQPESLAANVDGGTDSTHGNNLSRNVTKVSEILPSSDVVSAGTSSKRFPISKSQHQIDGGVVQSEGTGRCFSLEEVQIATKNFDDALVVGIGGFGKVYKGFIDDGATVVAMKRLNAESKQGAGEFWTEIKMLSKFRHTNLVALIGYCNECQEMILVYEYIARGTLADHLYKLKTTKGNTSISPSSWEQRLNMCIGAARGLDHLHSGTNQSFIHRDVKTTNILIDENWVAKVSDFGLSKGTASHSITHISTAVKGTFGYLDPDYYYFQRLTAKSDVYSFGVVLLEVLCGRPALDKKLCDEQISLVGWTLECIEKGKLAGIIDPFISGQIAPRCLKSFVRLASNCLQQSPKSRPTMAEALGSLELALVSQQRGRTFTEGIKTKMFQILMNRGNRSSSGQLKDLLSSSEDPEIHFKYIKEAAKAGQTKEVERVTRESNFYDPEKTKNFLMKAKLRDAQPLINVCNRFGFVPELTHYLYSNNMLSYIEGYVEKVNPRNALLVVRQLLDDDCPEDFIKGLILSVSSLLIIEPLVEELEKRNRFQLLTEFLEHLALLSHFSDDVSASSDVVSASSDVVSTGPSSNRFPILKSQHQIDAGVVQSEGTVRCFSLEEVLIATNNFDDASVIRVDGFGKVYKGFIDDGATIVAIKRRNVESKQGAGEFWTEIKLLSKLRHANLVALIGYCNECEEMIIVYEYIALGTLADHLYRLKKTESNTGFSPLSWEERLDMCIGAARGLDHLHSGTSQSFIHRDVKSTNILIDENWVAKISDFGLSKGSTSHSTTHISTEVKGTFGYLDPDYYRTLRLTAKSDVYSFGVVLLEVLCGRPPLDRKLSEEQMNLTFWAQECIQKGKLARIIDPSLSGQIAPRCLKSFVQLAKNCLQESPKSRPTMAIALSSLEFTLVSQQRGRTEGIMTKTFQILMNRGNRSSSGQLKDLQSSSEDTEIHFKYIEAAAKAGKIEEVERTTRESNFYDPEKTKNLLMKAKLRNARPLMNVCDRLGFVPDLTHYLYSNNMLSYIECYVQKVNPGNAPLVVRQLLDDDCPEDFIKGLILSSRSLLTIEPLLAEFEKRNRLGLLTQFLEHLVSEGSQDVHVHNALGKVVIDSNNNPEHFLTTNPYYDSLVLGNYCEERDPTLAVVAYRRGQCDKELINVTNKNNLFKLQARYVVERKDGDLWAMVLNPENEFRRQLIDQLASTEGFKD